MSEPLLQVDAGDDDTVELLIDPAAAVENLVDVLAENPILLRALGDAVRAAQYFNELCKLPTTDAVLKMRQSHMQDRATQVETLASSEDIHACLVHVLTDKQAGHVDALIQDALATLAGQQLHAQGLDDEPDRDMLVVNPSRTGAAS